MLITSTRNKLYKSIKSLQAKKGRSQTGCFVVEGIKSVFDALESDWTVTLVAHSSDAAEKVQHIIQLAQHADIPVHTVSASIFHGLCDTMSPEGVICVVRQPQQLLHMHSGLYVYCDRIRDPGNAGTIIRTADAVGAAGVLLSPACVDLYAPKTLRAAMGSLFHIEVFANVGLDVLAKMRENGFRIIAGTLGCDSVDYQTAGWQQNCVIAVGNEANGVSDELLSLCDVHAHIPIYGQAESLNASIAAGLLMYEWRRNQKK